MAAYHLLERAQVEAQVLAEEKAVLEIELGKSRDLVLAGGEALLQARVAPEIFVGYCSLTVSWAVDGKSAPFLVATSPTGTTNGCDELSSIDFATGGSTLR